MHSYLRVRPLWHICGCLVVGQDNFIYYSAVYNLYSKRKYKLSGSFCHFGRKYGFLATPVYFKSIFLSGFIFVTLIKAQDDSQKEEDDGSDIDAAAGFNFKVLKTRFPDLQKEIRKFAKYVSDTSQEIQPMKAWQMGDLSLQAAQHAKKVHNENPEESLQALTDIASNFPQQGKKLARIQVSSKLKKEVAANADVVTRSVGLARGSSHFQVIFPDNFFDLIRKVINI